MSSGLVLYKGVCLYRKRHVPRLQLFIVVGAVQVAEEAAFDVQAYPLGFATGGAEPAP